MELRTRAAVAELSATQSPKRRSAAKKLRRMRDTAAGPSLLVALEKEVLDPRTWETQYQLIMALGECDYAPALATLERLAAERFEATMVYVALGDAIVRLSRGHENDASPVLHILRHSKNQMLIDGAFRAMAMLRMVPGAKEVREVLGFMRRLERSDPLRFWVAAAAPGWKHPDVHSFLDACETSGRDDVVEAARLARVGEYKKWSPL